MPQPRTGSGHGRLRPRSFGQALAAKPDATGAGSASRGTGSLASTRALSPSPGQIPSQSNGRRMWGGGSAACMRRTRARVGPPARNGIPQSRGPTVTYACDAPGLFPLPMALRTGLACEPPPGIELPSGPRLRRSGCNAPPGHSHTRAARPPLRRHARRPHRSRRSDRLSGISPGSPPDAPLCPLPAHPELVEGQGRGLGVGAFRTRSCCRQTPTIA